MSLSSLTLNETHDTELRSWVPSANADGCPFPIQNLPYGVFRRAGSEEDFRVGVAIGDQILDLPAAHSAGAFSGFDEATRQAAHAACSGSRLNALMALTPASWSALRLALSHLLRTASPHQTELAACLVPQAQAEYDVPAAIGDYTDFYTSIHHATTVGKLFRPDNPLLPNYKWVPIGYHGRVSSIAVSGQQFRRPLGQTKAPDADAPTFGPCKRLDYELEIGIFIGGGNALGEPVPMEEAEDKVFGLCLLNDWSARDVQAWEYQPLGPFLSKSFASTISPWIVTLEALAPYRCSWSRPDGDPQPLPYLDAPTLRTQGAFDVQLEVLIQTAAMRQAGQPPQRLSLSNYRDAYWTVAQLVTHHTVNGCNLRPGDFLGSGTLSGPAPDEAGSLLELTTGGKSPLTLASGEKRVFLEDGDTIILRAVARRDGLPLIGFGESAGTVLPARSQG
ncbi:fumarylacetoacetase [Herbaspirillum seropedicae]|uniref:fumarylacetoacetase n=1 Tax=Herbaspirillum seropedicae TaxID=964 RepID=UPI000847F3BB|nr:fumarylacetoacetase [Herbaspirillum seropedicae]AON53355.1 2-keto-4-pentenoate hydratase [Herbaspirillum seropedicae]